MYGQGRGVDGKRPHGGGWRPPHDDAWRRDEIRRREEMIRREEERIRREQEEMNRRERELEEEDRKIKEMEEKAEAEKKRMEEKQKKLEEEQAKRKKEEERKKEKAEKEKKKQDKEAEKQQKKEGKKPDFAAQKRQQQIQKVNERIKKTSEKNKETNKKEKPVRNTMSTAIAAGGCIALTPLLTVFPPAMILAIIGLIIARASGNKTLTKITDSIGGALKKVGKYIDDGDTQRMKDIDKNSLKYAIQKAEELDKKRNELLALEEEEKQKIKNFEGTMNVRVDEQDVVPS